METKDSADVLFLVQLFHPGRIFRFGVNRIAAQAAENQPFRAANSFPLVPRVIDFSYKVSS
jgi:hypothetical protein